MNLENIDISKLPSDVRKTFLRLKVLRAEKKIQNKAKDDFMSFVKCVWPEFIEGAHHRHICLLLNVYGLSLLKALITDTLQINLINLHLAK